MASKKSRNTKSARQALRVRRERRNKGSLLGIDDRVHRFSGGPSGVGAGDSSGPQEGYVHPDTGLVYGDTYGASNSSIVSFPSDYEYLVALYAAIKSLGAKMGAIRNSLSSFSITAVPPDMPTTGAAIPTYNASEGGGTLNDEITQMLTYIETDEDVELSNAKATEITLRLKRALDQ